MTTAAMTTPAASVAIKKPKSKSNPLDGSTYKRCMCSWKKPDTWPVTADLETQLPWCVYLLQTVAQHADSDDVWHGVPYRFVAKDDIKQSSEKIIALRQEQSAKLHYCETSFPASTAGMSPRLEHQDWHYISQ